MRRLWIAAAAMLAGLSLATPAAAQRVWQNGRWIVMPHSQARPPAPPRANRWGPVIDGRWDGGNRAPGGWSAYRRPVRGWSLPGYWRDTRFRIPDYLSFGLSAPPRGYYWARYYDDAVLVDQGGRVWDSMGGIAWAADDGYSAPRSSVTVVSAGAGYPPPPSSRRIESVDPNAYYDVPGPELAPEPGYDADPIRYSQYPAGGYAPPVVEGSPAVQVYTTPTGYGGTTTVVVIPSVTTTTTTTETYGTTYRRTVRR
ncbi:RcnB family protein [Sphingomonas sp. dw_22]|uniref:RcnB family protein n=1 Tax=Sphingomonas sp. dw_22 TaxID=2721175 RepID=UPI001BD26DF4|nr:RcnB family protein [Sphingomonas sp. dw_22]